MPDLHPLETRLADSWPPQAWRDVTVLAAVSGGPDSVAMLRALAALKTAGSGKLAAAHFNHRLRGPAADDDEAFVAGLCRKLTVPCEIGRAEPGRLAAASTDGLEAAARAARYGFLEKAAGRVGARYLVTAHTADDQAETVLHRILRGTGIGGLAGMARARPLVPGISLIRPLLDIRRAELLAYLDDLGQPFREDPSNADPRFTRNRIRRLLPRLAEDYNPAVADALVRLGRLAGEVHGVVDGLVEDLASRAVRREPSGVVQIAEGPLAVEPAYLVRELLAAVWRQQGWPQRAMGFDEWERLAEMLRRPPNREGDSASKQVFPGGVVATRGEIGLALARSD